MQRVTRKQTSLTPADMSYTSSLFLTPIASQEERNYKQTSLRYFVSFDPFLIIFEQYVHRGVGGCYWFTVRILWPSEGSSPILPHPPRSRTLALLVEAFDQHVH